MDQVRDRISRDYNVSNITFDNTNADNNNGRQDRISGTARSDRGNRRGDDRYSFSCDVNLNNGNVRNVNVRRN